MVAVTLSLLFTLQALPATLTQERRVVPPGPLTRAANAQIEPYIASNGHGFLAIWIDGRASHSVYQPTGNFLWASHFAVDGSLTSAAGMKLADGLFDARIASDGNDYLVAMRRPDGFYTQRFDDEGHALADAIKIGTAGSVPMMLASNGSSYLFATNVPGGVQWQMLDRLGHPAGDPQIVSASSIGDDAVVVTTGGVYHLIYETQVCVSGQGCAYGIADMAVTNGHAAEPRTLVAPSNFVGYIAAASAGNRFLLTWISAAAINEQLFDSNDNAATAVRALGANFQAPLIAGWDGSRYLVMHSEPGDALGAQRVGADGEPLDAAPFLVASNAALQPALASGGGRVGVVWSASSASSIPPDVYGRVVFDFNELAATVAAPLRLSNAPSVQHAPAAASFGGRTIRVWRAGDGNGSIEMALDGGDTVVLSPENGENQHDPDVAAIGDVALIAWRSDTRLLRRVLGIRIDANGNRLDPNPIVIDEDTLPRAPALDRVSLATDGQTFLAAWSGQYVVHAKRIAKDGSVLDAAPIVASHSEFSLCTGVKAVWTGTTYVVVFGFEDPGLTLRPPVSVVQLDAARITTSGVALDAAVNRTVYKEPGATLGDLSAAAAGEKVVIAFSELPATIDFRFDLRTVDVSTSASQLITELEYPFTCGIRDVGIAARGETFLVAWSQDGPNGTQVRAQLLDRGESFVVSEDDAYDVTVSANANGFTFTYARTDPDALDVAQLFTRELVMTPERHRAVR
jgi:hypothetical protein